MSNEILDELNASFVSPEKDYKGEVLAPYTEGSRLLLMQVRDDGDSSIYFIWSFLYLHILLAKNRKEAIKIAWNKDNFRESLMDWVSNKTEADRDLATSLVSKIIEESNRGQVEVVAGAGQNKLGNE
jgi:hypothetical protein